MQEPAGRGEPQEEEATQSTCQVLPHVRRGDTTSVQRIQLLHVQSTPPLTLIHASLQWLGEGKLKKRNAFFKKHAFYEVETVSFAMNTTASP